MTCICDIYIHVHSLLRTDTLDLDFDDSVADSAQKRLDRQQKQSRYLTGLATYTNAHFGPDYNVNQLNSSFLPNLRYCRYQEPVFFFSAEISDGVKMHSNGLNIQQVVFLLPKGKESTKNRST